MRVLIDECLPRALKRLLAEHECRTVQEMGWSGKKNGLLLSLAEAQFDVLVTMDQGMEYQQNLPKLKIAVLAFRSETRWWRTVVVHFTQYGTKWRMVQRIYGRALYHFR